MVSREVGSIRAEKKNEDCLKSEFNYNYDKNKLKSNLNE